MPVPEERGALRRTLLRDDVYRSILEAIVRREFHPGEKLVDASLQEWLGVSRTPIREALLRLERQGLVSSVPGRTTIVAPDDWEAVAHSAQVVAELHALAARIAVPRLGESEIEALAGHVERFAAGVAQGDPDMALGADDDLHQVFVGACANPVLADQLEQITPLLRRAERLRFDSVEGPESVRMHEGILAAARAGDADGAAELSRANWMTLATLPAAD